MTSRRPAIVVGLACSAGGLGAICRILARLPVDIPATTIALRHYSPLALDRRAEILRTTTSLPVGVAQDGQDLTPGTILVAPTGFHTLVTADHRISLIRAGSHPPYRPSADLLFTTMALGLGRRAIAVILSGHGNDGTTGATAVHHHGGLVITSDRATSTEFAMPGAAIDNGVADEVLPVDDIAARLTDIVSGLDEGALAGAAFGADGHGTTNESLTVE
jgi:two-component system chemotaxis response regulator CheB